MKELTIVAAWLLVGGVLAGYQVTRSRRTREKRYSAEGDFWLGLSWVVGWPALGPIMLAWKFGTILAHEKPEEKKAAVQRYGEY